MTKKRTFGTLAAAVLPLSLLCLLSALPLQAQTSQQTFGKNRIQYKDFKWQFYSTQNFNVYFNQGGQEMARNAAEFAERELKRVTSLIGYYPYSKITLILYNSVGDLRQSNIGLNQDPYQAGGENFFLKNKVEIAFGGTQTEFKRDLSYSLTKLLLNDMMYGGSLREVLQSTYMMRLPEWFISGAAAYIAEGWSIDMDNYMRDMVLELDGRKSDPIFIRNSEMAGQSIWSYITERYGYTAIQNILNLTRITRDVQVGVSSSINVPYKRFMREWFNYYQQINAQYQSDGPAPGQNMEEHKLERKNRRQYLLSEPVLSPDGTKLAYVRNDRGAYKVIVRDVATSREKVVGKGGYKSLEQEVDKNMPLLAWRSPTMLGIVELVKGKPVLRHHSLSGGKTSTIDLGQYSLVHGLSYSEDGQMLVVSGVKNGQSDLYLYRSNSRQPEQLTNDVFDDKEPIFLRGGKSIAFSSNRIIDTLGTDQGSFARAVNNYDIFVYNPEATGYKFNQITSSISNEERPRSTADGNLIYIGEENGIRALYQYDFSSGEARPVTSFLQNIKDFDFHSPTGNLVFTSPDQAREFVYLFRSYQLPQTLSLAKTHRQQTLENLSAKAAQRRQEERRLVEQKNQVAGEQPQDAPADGQKPRQTGVDINNYTFESDTRRTPARAKSPVVRSAAPENIQVLGPFDYDLRFSINNISSGVYIDPLLSTIKPDRLDGLGLVGEVTMSDMFENHHIRGNVFALTDLRTSSFYTEYTNLERRYDFRLAYYKQSIMWEREFNREQYGRHEISPVISYPLSHASSIRFVPRLAHVRFTNINLLNQEDIVTNFVGAGAEYVYDNSIATGVNMLEGTRFKAGISAMRGINKAFEDFNQIYLDLRHYQKVHRQIIFANRISYGNFFGNNPKRFRLGGMDNWLFARHANLRTQDVPTPADLLYTQFATNLRGFDYNARNGNQFLLVNSELRIPIIQYLFRGPISSGFFRNLQLTAFADAGTAYEGVNPFSDSNSFNTRVVGGGNNPFEAIVINYRNPFLFGYGFGARTTLLGIYGKFDIAWGEEDKTQVGPKFYFTLGYDF
jgi:WD40 repeat protein